MRTNARSLAGRVVVLVSGAAASAYGYLMTATSRLGNGPLFAVQDGLHHRLGWSLATAATVVGLVIVVIAAALRAPLGVGTISLPLLVGWWISRFDHHVIAGAGLAARWTMFGIGTTVMVLGGVLAFTASLGASALDAVMLGLAARLGRSPAGVRIAMEVSMAVGGAAIGGRVGAGTVAMGATVGPLFEFWRRQIDRIVRRRTAPAPAMATSLQRP